MSKKKDFMQRLFDIELGKQMALEENVGHAVQIGGEYVRERVEKLKLARTIAQVERQASQERAKFRGDVLVRNLTVGQLARETSRIKRAEFESVRVKRDID